MLGSGIEGIIDTAAGVYWKGSRLESSSRFVSCSVTNPALGSMCD